MLTIKRFPDGTFQCEKDGKLLGPRSKDANEILNFIEGQKKKKK